MHADEPFVGKFYEWMRAPMKQRWAERLADYVEKRPHEVVYRIPAEEAPEHLQQLGALLAEISEEWAERDAESKVRAVIEATVRSVKRPCTEAGKLPERGLERAAMMLYGAAMMSNMRRLHRRYFTEHLEGEARAYFCGVVLGVFHRIRRWIVTDLVHQRIRFGEAGPYSKTVGRAS